MGAAAAQRAVFRDPGLNQVPLHARQQGLAVVQRQAERVEGRMGPRTAIVWKVYPPEGRAEKAAEFGRYLVVRNEQAKVIRQCNQMPVEQPVGRRRESQTVLDNVRTAIRDRHDVCRLSLCASASVNNAQAGDGTGIIVCIHDGTPKRRISNSTIDQELLDLLRDNLGEKARQSG